MKAGSAGTEVNIELRRGATVQGQVVGPDGKPLAEASMISPVILTPYLGAYRSWNARYQGSARDGHFAVYGLDPETEAPVFFLEPKSKLGATIRLSGKSAAGGPISVKLEPCGTAKARLVGPDGKPVPGHRPTILMLIIPGSLTRNQPDMEREGRLGSIQGAPATIDPTNYPNSPASDAHGQIAYPALIPGATYRLIDWTSPGGPQLRQEFTAKPGEEANLGDILVEKPPAPR